MANTIEDMIGSGLATTTGDPVFLGLLFLGFFVGILVVNNASGDIKILVLIPVAVLSVVFMPFLLTPIVLIGGIMFALALIKFVNR